VGLAAAVLILISGLFILKNYKSLGSKTIRDKERLFQSIGFSTKYNKKATRQNQVVIFTVGSLMALIGILILADMFLTNIK
jgi:hypothetical protein